MLVCPFGTLVCPFSVSGLGCGSRVCAWAPRTVEEAAHGGASAWAAAEETKRGLPSTGSSSPSEDAASSSRSLTTAEAGWLARVPFPLWGKGTIGVWGFLFCSFLFSSVLGERASAKSPVAFSSSAGSRSPSVGVLSASAASCFTSAGSPSAAIEVGAKSPVAFSSSASGASSSAGWGSPSAGVISFSLDVGSSSAGSFFTSAGSRSFSAGSASPSAGSSSSAGGRALSAARRRTARRRVSPAERTRRCRTVRTGPPPAAAASSDSMPRTVVSTGEVKVPDERSMSKRPNSSTTRRTAAASSWRSKASMS